MSVGTRYATRLGPFGPRDVRVHDVVGHERISDLYRFDLGVTANLPPEVFERAILARRGILAIETAGRRRAIHGVVVSVRSRGERRLGNAVVHAYDVRLAPRLALLRHKKTSRIFRHLRVDQVIARVLGEAGIDSIFRLASSGAGDAYPVCDYLTQYEETDYAFIRRLAAENGILFSFEQPSQVVDEAIRAGLDGLDGLGLGVEPELGPAERVVFTNRATYATISDDDPRLDALLAATPFDARIASLPYFASGALADADREVVSRFELERGVRPTATTYRDYDPMKPRTLIESRVGLGPPTLDDAQRAAERAVERAATIDPSAIAGTSRELATDLASDGMDALVEPSDLGVYAYGGRHLFPDLEDSMSESVQMLRQLRRRARVARGTSNSARIEPGRRFHLDQHPDLSREYVVTEVRHRGGQGFAEADRATPRTHVAEFECVPATVAYLPKLPRRRAVQVCLTGTVVGPAGQDVHVNSRGEIKVRFHWDRRAGAGDDASAWIRTMHGWAGAGWGTQFIPRVGMEVVVTFEAGDPDRPLVLGAVYNGLTPTPFSLPADKTRSGIRTRSTPDGEDGNELSFEDARDREQVYVRAKRDLDTVVERNRTATIRAEDRTVVDGDHTVEVGGRHVTVARSERTVDVRQDDRLHVRGNRNVDVDADLSERVGRARSTRVEGADRREVVGESTTTVDSDLTTSVLGNATFLVGRHDRKRSVAARVEGRTAISGSEVIDIASDKEVVLRCGSSFVRIAAGEIEIASSKVTVRGEDARLLLADGDAKIKAKSAFQVVADDHVVLKSPAASLGLKTDAALDGAQVLLNSPTSASDTLTADNPSPTTIELVDQDGNPIPYQRFRLLLNDGSEISGFLGEDGKAEVLTTQGGHVVFPDLADTTSG